MTLEKVAKGAVIMMVLSNQAAATAGQEKLYTAKGYPYQNLINKAEQVSIHYVEDAQDDTGYVECHVEVDGQKKTRKTAKQRVNKNAFDQAPLASCLGRKKAKEILAALYAE